MSDILNTSTDVLIRYLLVGSVTAMVLTALAWLIIKAARIRTCVYRHMIWLYCLVGTALLPALWLCAPKMTLAVLPARAQPLEIFAPPQTIPAGEMTPARERPAEPLGAARPTGPVTETRSFPWRTALAGLWLLGFVFMLARLALGWLRLRRVCRAANAAPQTERLPETNRLRPRILLTTELQSPVCFGVLRPVILLGRDMYEHAAGRDLHMVLAHELAHIERGDCWANLFQRLVEAVFFFHPLVWLASRRLTQQREHICDNYVLAQGASPDDYTALLSHIGEQALGETVLTTVALYEGQLLARVRSLLDPLRSRKTRLPLRAAIACTFIVLVVFSVLGSVRLAAKPAERPAAEAAASTSDPSQARTAKTLHEAAADGDIEQVKLLISKGADVNAKSGRWGWTPLHMAARYGHKDVCEILILNGADVNAKARPGQTPLLYAARYGHMDVAELLIDKGADVNADSDLDGTPLYCAAAGGHKELAELLLAKGADVDAALLFAARQGHLNATKFLLARGANVSAKDDKGQTPLHGAAMMCHKDVAELLIARGADVNAKDNDGATPAHVATTLALTFDKRQIIDMVKLLLAKGARLDIHLAAFVGDVQKVKSFLEQGTNVDSKAMFSQTPLCLAALAGQREMVRLLIGKGADVNAQAGISSKAPLGSTPLHFALIYPDYEVVKLLIDNGADVKAEGFLGSALMVPLLAAEVRGAKVFEDDSGLDIGFSDEEFDRAMEETVNARGGKYIRRIWPNLRDVVELFLEKGADVNERALGGRVLLLHQVADAGIKDAVELFVAYGADVNAKDMEGWTPLHYACWKNHKDIAELLLAKGADINAKEQEGKTPLEVAKEKGHTEIVKVLRKHGAKE